MTNGVGAWGLGAAQRVLRASEEWVPVRLRTPIRYGAAVAVVGVTAALQLAAMREPSLAPFALFFFGVALVSWLAGAGPGLAAVLLSALAVNYLFVPPFRAWSLSPAAMQATAAFAGSATGVSVVSALLRGALLEAARSALALERHSRMLERAHDAVLKSEEQLRLMVEAAQAGVWDWDVATGAFAGSERCRALLELPPGAEPTYQRFLSAIHPQDREAVERAMRAALEAGRDCDVELRVPLADGAVRWVVFKGRGSHAPGGAAVRMTGMALDVTERRRAEEELRVADQRKSEFLGVLSHELRNPLTPLMNGLSLLRRAAPGSEPWARALEVIERQARQLTRLTDDLLDVTRVSRGKIRLRREGVELQALLRRVVADHRTLFESAGVHLEERLEAPAPLLAYADPVRVTQLVGNLLSNAAKFTPRGGSVQVTLRAEGRGQAVLTVADSGVGIAPDTLGQLFQPFVQAERSLARTAGGLGLGLALVRRLAELHGGRASAESDGLGRGATFTVRLPLDRRRAARLSLVPPAPAPVRPLDVLLIEDNVDAALTLREALELGGHRVEVAHSGADGLALAARRPPEVVVCDIGLPGMSGYEVARAFRADARLRGARLIALSGYAQPDDVERALEAGFDQHLAKPPDLSTLEQALAGPAAPPGARAAG